ncbi:MAG: SUMF1/EgtB/PvdO family nonheme iron enzyme [Anaerolineae bacterium]|nr:SUMF1/EgtB/PvdO family nonheme iron enzyme [Anaerolineae bacterium]
MSEFLIKIGVGTAKTSGSTTAHLVMPSAAPTPAAETAPQRGIGGKHSFDEAIDLLEAEDYEKALFILEKLRETGYRSGFASVIDDLIERANAEMSAAERRREAALDYDDILALAERKFTEPLARTAFADWTAKYADLVDALDVNDLRDRFKPTSPTPTRKRSLDLLPAPFAWIDIPGTSGKKWNDAPYKIAKYPVTNVQFRLFVETGGYRERKWWTEAGWQAREEGWHYDGGWKPSGKPWLEPRYWNDGKWNGEEQPMVGVSWYEAVAFCLWLSDVTGENIMLPTEAQWQYAAQGDDGRDYPWGKKWDTSRCNNNVGGEGVGKTTPVRQYEGKGDSFFGVVDMAGNVWDWCLTDYDDNTNDVNSHTSRRVLRGGSWLNNFADNFRCGFRLRNYPHYWFNLIGFRLALS